MKSSVSVGRCHLRPQEPGELAGDRGGHDRLDVLTGREGTEPSTQPTLRAPGTSDGCRRHSFLTFGETCADMGDVVVGPRRFAQLAADVAVTRTGDPTAVL